MKRLFALTGFLVTVATDSELAESQAPMHFAGVGWHVSRDSVQKAYVTQGLKLHRVQPDSSATFIGRIFDRDAAVIAQFTDSGLVHVEVILDVEIGLEYAQYQQLLEVLKAKYSKPADIFEGAFLRGMNGAGLYRSVWPIRSKGQPKPDRKNFKMFERVDLYSIRGKGVHVEYVSASWPREEAKRTAAKAAIFGKD